MLQVFVAISQKFCCRKEVWDYAKIIHSKKMEKCPIYLKQWVLDACPKKEKMNKIAPAL